MPGRGSGAPEPRPTATNMDGSEKVGGPKTWWRRSPDSFCRARRPSLAPPGGDGSGYSPCRQRSSKGARGEPKEVMPGPQGARPPPARLLLAAAEARAGLSALTGMPGPPRLAAGRSPPKGLRPSDAQTRRVQLPCRPAPRRLSCDRGRPVLASLAPQRHRHLALPQDPPAPRGAGGATPPNSRPATSRRRRAPLAPRRPLAPLGLPGNRGSSATPGGPPAE